MSLPECRLVRIRLRGAARAGALRNRTVKPHLVIDGVEVVYTYPEICVVTETTPVQLADSTTVAEQIYSDSQCVAFLVVDRKRGSRVHVISKSIWEKIEQHLRIFESGKSVSILAHGPPGSGKSSLVDILSGLYGLKVHRARADELVSKYMGETAKNVVAFLDGALKAAPCIIFFDEVEYILMGAGREGGVLVGSGGTEREFVMVRSVLLQDLERKLHESELPVILYATTNVPAKYFDEAFRRAGRFDLVLHVPYPSWYEVYIFLKLHTEHVSREQVERLCRAHGLTLSDESLKHLAKLFVNVGLSMADVAHLVATGKHFRDQVQSKERAEFKRMVSLCTEQIGLSSISEAARTLVTKIRMFYHRELLYVPRLGVVLESPTQRSSEQLVMYDHRYVLMPLLLHLLTEEGIPVVYVVEPLRESALREAMLTAMEVRGVLIVNAIALGNITAFPELANLIAESRVPVILLNIMSREAQLYAMVEDITVLMRTFLKNIREAALKNREILAKILRVYVENLCLKTEGINMETLITQAGKILQSPSEDEYSVFARLVGLIVSEIELEEKGEKREVGFGQERGFTRVIKAPVRVF